MIQFLLIPGWIVIGIFMHPDPEAAKPKEEIISYGAWEETRNSDGVKTYVRWIYFKSGRKIRDRKGELQANCSFEKAFNVLTDAPCTKKWMKGISENRVLSKINSLEWYTYTLYAIPWPFNQRDLVSLYRVQHDAHKTVINIYSKADYIPQKSNIERLQDYTAVWTITETGSGTVHIVFSAFSDTPLLVPRYIQDPVIEKMFHNNLVRLKELLSEKV